MRWRRLLLIVTLLGVTAAPGSAGIIFNRKPKPNPAERVPQLILQLKSDQDDDKRAAAAEELRQFDAGAHPEIVNALVEAALGDPKPKVRLEAVQTLGKLRPVSQRAGWALEQAAANDTAVRVQVQARSALLSYRMSGYHSSKNGEPPVEGRTLKTEEPPLAEPGVIVPDRAVSSPVKSTSAKRKITGRPPAAATPVAPPALNPAPKGLVGPELSPPK